MKTKRFLIRKILKPLGFNLDYYSPRPFTRFLKKQNKKGLIGIEIGVRDGWNALDLLENLSIKKLYLIDPYTTYKGYAESQSPNYQKWINKKKDIAKIVLKKYNSKIVWVYDFSEKAVSKIKEQVDFVYIDGNHEYPFIKKDIGLYYPKVKSGGVIGGDDYFYSEESKSLNFGVVKAVDEFFDDKIMFEDTDWWAVKK